MTADQRAALLTAAAAVSAFAALTDATRPRRSATTEAKTPRPKARSSETIDDLAALIAAW